MKPVKFVSLFLALIFICSFVLLEPAIAKAEEYYEVTAGTLNLREKATTKSSKIGRLSRPLMVRRLDDSVKKANGYTWYRVEVLSTGQTGYVASKYLRETSKPDANESEPVAGTGQYYKVISNVLNVREGASTGTAKIDRLSKGNVIQRVDETAKKAGGYTWYRVELTSGKIGYVAAKYLKQTDKPGSQAGEPTDQQPAAPTEIEEYYQVTARTLNVRAGASTSTGKVATLSRPEALRRLDNSAAKANGYTWYKVQVLSSGKVGYVASKYLTKTEKPVDKPLEDAVSSNTTDSSVRRTWYYQGDTKWKFSSSVAKNACVVASFAVLLYNNGANATPRTVYDVNGKRTSMNYARQEANFGVELVRAISKDSPYYSSFDGEKTYIKNPGKNAVKAIKEALELHPEGVMCYFSGKGSHAIVAIGAEGDSIIFCDVGRKRGQSIPFKTTWVYYSHKMTYSHLQYIVAID